MTDIGAGYKKSFAPLAGEEPRVLILGSLPGDESLRQGQYYAHARNRFWKIIAALTDTPCPRSYEEKKAMLAANHIALWDVARSASRNGSLDANIKNELPNDLAGFIREHPSLRVVAFNGQKTEKMFRKHFPDLAGNIKTLSLRSTSPANAKFSDLEMLEDWKRILE